MCVLFCFVSVTQLLHFLESVWCSLLKQTSRAGLSSCKSYCVFYSTVFIFPPFSPSLAVESNGAPYIPIIPTLAPCTSAGDNITSKNTLSSSRHKSHRGNKRIYGRFASYIRLCSAPQNIADSFIYFTLLQLCSRV